MSATVKFQGNVISGFLRCAIYFAGPRYSRGSMCLAFRRHELDFMDIFLTRLGDDNDTTFVTVGSRTPVDLDASLFLRLRFKEV